MQLFRVPVSWNGAGVVGLAVNVLHFDGSNQSSPPVAGILSAYQGLATALPSGVTVSVPNAGDIIDDTNGQLVGVWAGTGGGTVAGSTAGARAAGVGACVSWQTGGIVNGRRLRGRTFLVPLTSGAWDTDGTFQTSALAQLVAFGAALRAAGPLAVWHRPTTPGGTDGTSYGVTGHRVSDKTAVLRSRRD